MKHPTVRVDCCTIFVVFSTGFPPTVGFLLYFFHPDFLEVLPSALAFLPPSNLGLYMVEMAPPIL